MRLIAVLLDGGRVSSCGRSMNQHRHLDPQVPSHSGQRLADRDSLALCELHLAPAALMVRLFPRMRLDETTHEGSWCGCDDEEGALRAVSK